MAGLVASPVTLAAKAGARMANSQNSLRNIRQQTPARAKGFKLQPALAVAVVSG
jgi:hypothetical protein